MVGSKRKRMIANPFAPSCGKGDARFAVLITPEWLPTDLVVCNPRKPCTVLLHVKLTYSKCGTRRASRPSLGRSAGSQGHDGKEMDLARDNRLELVVFSWSSLTSTGRETRQLSCGLAMCAIPGRYSICNARTAHSTPSMTDGSPANFPTRDAPKDCATSDCASLRPLLGPHARCRKVCGSPRDSYLHADFGRWNAWTLKRGVYQD
jgi:hypothetical protein